MLGAAHHGQKQAWEQRHRIKLFLGQGTLQDPFVPLQKGLLVSVAESREVIENLLSQLPHMFEHTRVTEPVLGAAVQASVLAMKAFGGKMVIFASTMPTQGPGKLKVREEASKLGTDKERQLYAPHLDF